MNNVTELRDALANIFDELKEKKIAPEEAAQLTNCAGKIIGTIRVEMEYADRRSESPQIKFMDKP